ncbi:GAF domain-containing protein [Aggregatilineales bacterium SYSU G02658]
MNTQARFFPLWSQFLLVLGVAVLIPVGIMLLVVVDATNRLNERNLSALVEQVGRYREYLIQTDFDAALRLLDSVEDNALVYTLVVSAARNLALPGTTPETRQSLTDRTNADLRRAFFGIDQRLVDSYWLLSTRGEVLLSATNSNRTLPFNALQPNEETSEAFLRARDASLSTTTRLLILTNRGGQPNFEVVLILRDVVGITVGYLVLDLDLGQIVLRHLGTEVGLPLYSFVVLPDGRTALSLAETQRQNLIDVRTPAVQRALEGTTSGVLAYDTSRQGETRQLVGYYSFIRVLDQTLGFITEADSGLIITERLEYFSAVGVPLLLVISLLIAGLVLLLSQSIVSPVKQLRTAIQAATGGNFNAPLPATTRPDELGELNSSFAVMRDQVQRVFSDLKTQAAKSSREVQLTQEIAQVALDVRDIDVLMTRIVTLITDNFPVIYHAQVFLIDPSGRYAVLRASTGRAGQELLRRGHRLEVGSVSVIGQVTEQGQIVVVRDIGASAVHRQNEFLPETQAELAIPLKLENRVIGALDVQSKERDSFSEELIATLQTLANQITIAIENAQLNEKSQQLLRTVEQETRQRTQRSWQELFALLRAPMLSASAGNQTGYDTSDLREAVIRSGRTAVGTRTDYRTIPVVVPIKLRGLVVGVVELELREVDFSYGKVLLAEELVSRLAISLDNARLFLENARNAEREAFVSNVGDLLSAENTVKGIFETAIRELSATLGTPQIGVRLNTNGADNGYTLAEDVIIVSSSDSDRRLS